MKMHSKLIASVLSVIMTFALCASTAFATSAADVDITAAPVSSADVSSSDASSSFFSGFETESHDFKDFGVKLTLPVFELFVTPDTPDDVANAYLGITASGMIDSGYIFYDCDPNMSEYAFYCSYSITDSSKMLRSYNKLSDEQIQSMLNSANTSAQSYSLGDVSAVEFVKINGVNYIHSGFGDGTSTSDIYETVYNGIKYTFFMRLPALTSDEDLAAKEGFINSIKLYSGKLGYAYQGVSGLDTAAYIIIAVLALICLLLAFFIIRFSAFQKAAGSSFNVLGFDFPKDDDDECNEDVDELEDFDYTSEDNDQ